ncbi:hypothetical protein FB99_24660 [Pantoea agglomerans]|nr:hypothetical protein FB99_24660 [Pantoea agglomerans]
MYSPDSHKRRVPPRFGGFNNFLPGAQRKKYLLSRKLVNKTINLH